jgi:uncharacterized membrane protein YgaE (UPF0421/DUF939 family)
MKSNFPQQKRDLGTWDINKELHQVADEVKAYVNEIEAKPDDYAHGSWQILHNFLENAERMLTDYYVKKKETAIDYDDLYPVFDEAISYLTKKGTQEEIESQTHENHEEISNEMIVASRAIEHLVALIRNVQENMPIKNVTEEKSDLQRLKVSKATNDEFKGKK